MPRVEVIKLDIRESEHVLKAKQYFKEGYNCAQAVFLAFQDLYNIDFDTAAKLSSSFGGGMGRMREVCGTVSGMFMVIGALYGYPNPDATDTKMEHYARIKELAAKFKEEFRSIVCRELLENKRPCPELVEYAAMYTEEYIQNNPIK